MANPGRDSPRPGLSWCCVTFGKRTCKPNSVVCGHSSRRRVAADAHQRPTRRFRHLPGAASAHRADAQRCLAPGGRFPPYLVLLRVGFTLPRPLRDERCALTAPFHPYPGAEAASCFRGALQGGVAGAVSFLWHWPSTDLQVRVPDVIRHTALRSSDFPPPAPAKADPGSDRPVLLPVLVYRETWLAIRRPTPAHAPASFTLPFERCLLNRPAIRRHP